MIRLLLIASLLASHAYAVTNYTTFPLTENPISESSVWINGGVTGLDWNNFQTTGGNAFGTDTGVAFTDSTALYSGSWGATQVIVTVVKITRPGGTSAPEVEHRLRSTISAHVNSGYEAIWSCDPTSGYLNHVRWNGALGDFTVLPNGVSGAQYVLNDGDVLKSCITNNVIYSYLNGTLIITNVDSTFSSGLPGIGSQNCGTDYGFKDFGASDTTATVSSSPDKFVRYKTFKRPRT